MPRKHLQMQKPIEIKLDQPQAAQEKNPVKTYWNGEKCIARRCIVRVGKAALPTYWYAALEGQERQAVEVLYGDQKFYLDNADGSGWWKVTEGRGMPNYSHSNIMNCELGAYIHVTTNE